MKQSVSYKGKNECCGCTACMHVCPKSAITMRPDNLGFNYPYVDDALCINCGLCDKVCAFSPRSKTFQAPSVYAVRSKNQEDLEKSQSGGAFAVLSDEILKLGGVVYGAGYEEPFRVVHKRAETTEERDEFRFSKYTQSDLQDVFLSVKTDLENGRYVLFSGTSCQVAGLASYIGTKNSERLFLMDFVCHGVAAPAVWNAYVAYLQGKNGKIVEARFRDKRFGWAEHKESFLFESGKRYAAMTYRRLFYSNAALRYCCYECPYTNFNRCSDVTVADFWGWHKTHDEFKDNKGVSLVLLSSDKGRQLFDKIRPFVYCIESSVGECLQPPLQHPVKKSDKREAFEQDFVRHGFKYVAATYSDLSFKGKVKDMLRPLFLSVKSLLRR